MKQNPKSSKKLNLFVFFALFICISCSNDRSQLSEGEIGEVQITAATKNTIVYALVDNVKIPIYLSIPEECPKNGPFPAVVVMHGSYGMWYQNDPESQKMSGQFTEWQDILAQNCIVGAFVDSYTARGVTTRTGKWKELPDNMKISAQFVRPRDANAALSLLQNLVYEDGSPVVSGARIALLGFSDGATAVTSTLIDVDRVSKDFEWTQSSNGQVYGASDGVLPPPAKPEIGFAGGVFYYGGSVGYNYWGKHPCGTEALEGNVFYPYAPMLYQIPSDDDLTENTLCMLDVLKQKAAPVEMYYYPGETHGFDFDHNTQSEIARQRTINWLLEILNMN